MSEQVLVTGAYGFIASHCILQLLEGGWQVRGTLRNLKSQGPAVRQMFTKAGAAVDRLELVQADLMVDAGWDEAAAGCSYALHVASPVTNPPRSQAELLIRPAVDGTLRLMKAAAAAGVRRVVLTSSLAAVAEGQDDIRREFNEQDWTNLDHSPRPYAVSKTLAERAAWDFVASLGPETPLTLAAINPANVFGPLLDPRHTSSTELIIRMMRRVYPGCARLCFVAVDVRDVAAAHLLAMTVPAAAGQRFCCVSSNPWMVDIARILNAHYAGRGYHVPERIMPDWLVRLVTLFDPEARVLYKTLGVKLQISNRKILDLLGWQPRSLESSIIDTAESLIQFKLV